MSALKEFFASRKGIIIVGACIGVLAALLQKLGNPGNMGICVACFERDLAGAVGLHRADVVQYLRPEILGFVLGALIAALLYQEFRPRAGSAPIIRFVLGMMAMIGALVFLGCPWRALLRLAGGDGNAILGILGLAAGVWIGTLFFKSGYNLGRSQPASRTLGLIFPLMVLGALVLLLLFPQIPGKDKSGVLFYSLKGPGSMHAPLLISLGIGLVVGFVAQRSRFCTMGALRDLILFRQIHLLFRVHGPAGRRLSHQPDFRPIPPGLCQPAGGPYPGTLEFQRHGGGGFGLCPGRGLPRTAVVHGRRR